MYSVLKRDFVWNGDDVYYHFQRIMGISDNFTDGLLTSNISTSNFDKIGYGVNIFYPWLTLIPFQLIFHVSGDRIGAYYLGLLFYFFVSFLISHYSMKQFSKNTSMAVIFAIVYNFSTYRLIEVFSRAAVAEYIATIFLPLCFLGLYQIFFGDSKRWKPLAIGLSLIIFSHVLSVFMCLMMFFIVLILFVTKIKWSKLRVLNFIKAVVTTVLATLIFTVPFLMEESFEKYGVPDPMKLAGQDLSKLIWFSFKNTSNRMIEGNIYNIGLLLIVTLFVGILAFRKFDKLFKAIYILFILTFILSSNVFPWHLLQNTPIQVIQFPFRILMFTTLFGSAITARILVNVFENGTQRNFIVMTAVVSLVAGGLWYSSIQKAYPHSLLSKPQLIITKKMLNEDKLPETYVNQYMPSRAAAEMERVQHHEVNLNQKIIAQVPAVEKHGNVFTFDNIKKGDVIDLPSIRYKYTHAKLNGKNVPISFSKRGTVQIVAPRNYTHLKINLSYGNRNLFILATSLSVLAWIYLLGSAWITKLLGVLSRSNKEILSTEPTI